MINGWRMQLSYVRSLRSLRPVSPAFGLPLDRMSDDEVEASVVNFSLLARMYGMSLEEVAAAVRHVKEGQAVVRDKQRNIVH